MFIVSSISVYCVQAEGQGLMIGAIYALLFIAFFSAQLCSTGLWYAGVTDELPERGRIVTSE